MPSFSLKPLLHNPNSSDSNHSPKVANPPHRPPPTDGSDIDHADPAFFVAWVDATVAIEAKSTNLELTDVTPNAHGSKTQSQHSHKLILNKFCVVRPQYLLLTTDPSRKQTSPLMEQDLRAAWIVLEAFEADGGKGRDGHNDDERTGWYVVFNGGREAGSSRMHLHLQVLPMPRVEKGERELAWDSVVEGIGKGNTEGDETLDLPYLAFGVRLRSRDSDLLEDLVAAYGRHYAKCRQALEKRKDEAVPHNIILTRNYVITIPRRAATVEGIAGHSVGAQGMLGLIWCNKEAQIEGWRSTGPINVLRELGIPRQ